MTRSSHRIAAVATAAVLAFAGSTPAFADDSSDDGALPPLPKPSAEDAPARAAAESKDDPPVVYAKTVKANHVDTVIVQDEGGGPTVHRRSHREYAPDPGRKAAIIAAPIIFGVGGAVSGIAYVSQHGQQTCTGFSGPNGQVSNSCTTNDASAVLWTYNVIVAGVPSAPRWVVGDVMGALIYTGLRTASVVTASTIRWGNDSSSWVGPFMLGFLAPVTLGIVDLATTPHREDLRPRDGQHDDPADAKAQTGFRVSSIAPTTLMDPEHRVNGAMLTVGATF